MIKPFFILCFLSSTLLQFINISLVRGQIKEIDSVHSVLRRSITPEKRIDNLTSLAFLYKELDTDSAIYFAKRAIELSAQSKINHQLPKIYNLIGLAHYYQNEFIGAYDDFQQALSLAESMRDEAQIGHAHNNLGRLLLKINLVGESYEQFVLARHSFEKVNDVVGLSYLYRSLSELHRQSKNYDSAIFYTVKAIKIRKQTNEKNALVSALLNLSQLYRQKKEYNRSILFLKEAEGFALSIQNPLLLADTKLERLELMLEKDSLANSNTSIEETLKLVKDSKQRLYRLQLIEARIEKARGNTAHAIALLSGLASDTTLSDTDLRRESTSELIELLYAKGDFKQAELLRSQLKMMAADRRKTKLLEDIGRINLKYENERKSIVAHELETKELSRQITFVILLSAVVSVFFVSIILLFYKTKRAKEKQQHLLKEKELRKKFVDIEMVNKKLVEESLLLICTHDLEGKLLTINTPGAKTIGYESNMLVGKSIKVLIGNKQQHEFEKYITEIKLTGTSSGFLKIQTNWKESKIFLYRNILVSDENTMPYVMGSAIDVTEWKNTEQEQKRLRNELAESERLYRLLSENSNDLVCLHAADGTFQFVSNSVNDLLGYQAEELIGTKLQDLVYSEDVPPFHSKPEEFSNPSFEEDITYRVRKKNGSYLWMETYTQPIFENGAITSFQTSSRDVTERKHYEEYLNLAKTKAEEANKFKSEFVSSMSHEIRTPLNAIVGLAGILLKRNPREDQVKIFQMLKNSSDNLLAIVNDILDFSKVEAGKMEVEETTFDLPETLEEITELFITKAESKQIQLLYEKDSMLPQMIVSDQLKIRQIVTNLISNAIKFTNQGNVTMICRPFAKENGFVELLFSFKDTGIGIEPDKLDLIFESFSQAGHDTSRVYGGTGLGLAIVKKMLNLLGSEIAVESKIGEGSHFYFTLVVKKAETSNHDH